MEFDRPDLSTLSDHALTSEVATLAAQERRATAALVAALAEFDARRLYLPAGCSSLFTYCTQVLYLSEHAAYNRIGAARAARRVPALLEHLANGDLTLTAARLLAPHVTEANHVELFERARHKGKRNVEEIVAALRPQPDAASFIRKLPSAPAASPVAVTKNAPLSVDDAATRMPGRQGGDPREHRSQDTPPDRPGTSRPLTPSRPAVVAPLAPDRFKVQFTVSRETYDKLRRAQDLLRHVVPTGDPAVIVDRALTLLVAELEKRKGVTVKRPRKAVKRLAPSEEGRPTPEDPSGASRSSRHIPAVVRRKVWKRDEGRCAYIGTAGRCEERGPLEFHHVVPYADGGEATPWNIELRCRRHNGFEAERWFGEHTLPTKVREIAPSWSAPTSTSWPAPPARDVSQCPSASLTSAHSFRYRHEACGSHDRARPEAAQDDPRVSGCGNDAPVEITFPQPLSFLDPVADQPLAGGRERGPPAGGLCALG